MRRLRYGLAGDRPLFAAILVLFILGAFVPLRAQEAYLGEIRMFAGNFAPRGWALCNGQLLSISQNTALFSLLGTTYGGNGTTTFALPDLQGRVPVHAGSGPGLTPRILGERSGEETHTLTVSEIPSHAHSLLADSSVGTTSAPGGMVHARNAAGIPNFGPHTTTQMQQGVVGSAGGSQPHTIMQPYLVINYIIALEGIFPSRN
jgi:microcystin-dependent protein